MDSVTNPYQTPESDITDKKQQSVVLASRWNRFFASIIDTLTTFVIFIPLIILYGYQLFSDDWFAELVQKNQNSYLFSIAFAVIYSSIYILINFNLLKNHGQTIGKKLLRIKIVSMNGELPNIHHPLPIRYGIYLFSGQIPLVGGLVSLVNILLIFTAEKPCLHDRLAKTHVVVA